MGLGGDTFDVWAPRPHPLGAGHRRCRRHRAPRRPPCTAMIRFTVQGACRWSDIDAPVGGAQAQPGPARRRRQRQRWRALLHRAVRCVAGGTWSPGARAWRGAATRIRWCGGPTAGSRTCPLSGSLLGVLPDVPHRHGRRRTPTGGMPSCSTPTVSSRPGGTGVVFGDEGLRHVIADGRGHRRRPGPGRGHRAGGGRPRGRRT